MRRSRERDPESQILVTRTIGGGQPTPGMADGSAPIGPGKAHGFGTSKGVMICRISAVEKVVRLVANGTDCLANPLGSWTRESGI